MQTIQNLIRTIPHYPKPGIMFRDITTLIGSAEGLQLTIDEMLKRYKGKDLDVVVGIESRGFIIGSILAYALGKGFVPIRKKGKLPGQTIKVDYQLEYGVDTIEIHVDAIKAGQKVLLVDDLLATGGTAMGACDLIKKTGGVVQEACFIVDLPELGGKKRLVNSGVPVFALTEFDGH